MARAPQPWDRQDQRRPAVGAQRASYHPVPKGHPSQGSGHSLGVLGTPSLGEEDRGPPWEATPVIFLTFPFPHLYDGNNSCGRGAAEWKGLAGPRLPELRKEDVGSTQEDFSIAFHELWVWGFCCLFQPKETTAGFRKKVCGMRAGCTKRRRCGNSQLEQHGRTHR